MVWRFDSPALRIWPALADTVRFNEAAGLPRHPIEDVADARGHVRHFGRARMGPFRLAWEEIPANWVSGRWFEHTRLFTAGPLRRLTARLDLEDDAGGCTGVYTLSAEPAGWIGHLVLAAGFFRATQRNFDRLAAMAAEFGRGLRATPFDPPEPRIAPETRARVLAMVERIEASGHGHGLADRLARHVLESGESDLAPLRPLRLARLWGVAERAAIELCLQAVREGLLELRWELLCPRCRIAKSSVEGLDRLPEGAHCPTCNIDYGRDFARNVELAFRPAETVRPLGLGEYCLFGPMSTPHVRLQLHLGPGERQSQTFTARPGPWRLRGLDPGPELDLEVGDDGRLPELRLEAGGFVAGAPAPAGTVVLVNATVEPCVFVLEERHWAEGALTALRVTALQTFRDLFADQVLRPGDEVAVRRVTLLFTDLRGSSALYERVGDARAYHLVRAHFAYLAAIVRDHDGAVVKTIGDAVMAAFAAPEAGLQAALAIQERIARFNTAEGGATEGGPTEGEGELVIRLGLHEGPCIAVTLNDRLDYFGRTVNLAARLQGESRGGDVVFSAAMAQDPRVAASLAGLAAERGLARLKGFERPVPFLRLRPGPG